MNMQKQCPQCGSMNTQYVGGDVGGDVGELLCDIYICDECDQQFEANCKEAYEDELPSSQEGVDLGFYPSLGRT